MKKAICLNTIMTTNKYTIRRIFTAKSIIAPLLMYSLLGPGLNLARHYFDYNTYRVNATFAKTLDEWRFWDGVSDLVKDRMNSNDIFEIFSYETNRIKADYIPEKERDNTPKPEEITTILV